MSAQSNGLVAAAQQNEAGGATPKNRSLFPLSYSFYETERFADLTPFFVQEGVSGDRLPLHSNHEVQSYTLGAPLMQSIIKKKDFFFVPMQAILPLNWEKFYTNPVIGEDVPDDVGCGVENFWGKVASIFNNDEAVLDEWITTANSFTTNELYRFLSFLIFYERFYSTGSLMETLGISGHDYIQVRKRRVLPSTPQSLDVSEYAVWDNFFDDCMSLFSSRLVLSVEFSGTAYLVSNYGRTPLSSNIITWREFIDMMRDEPYFTITSKVEYAPAGSGSPSVFDELAGIWAEYNFTPVGEGVPLNTSRLWAYQLVCHHFYSNDHVDFIYSAELFRQYIANLVLESEGVLSYFTVNDYHYEYDYLSAYYTDIYLTSGVVDGSSPGYFRALLGFNQSLRYMDYFTGARTRPLAIGDTSVDASSGLVDVLDLSRSRMMAKFLQAVNRSGRKFGAYMKELFGKTPAPDYHNPFYLAHTSDVVGTSTNQNTGSDQRDANAFTANFRTNASRYAFSFEPDRDCIVIGISYYDIPRVYARATERQNFFIDRFDMFNTYMQFIGDQSIYQAEIGTPIPSMSPFGYQNRHMEYKQRYNQCCGAFANPQSGLDNWIFVADTLHRYDSDHISSGFIRSFNAELDHFYTSLTGFGLGSYFHFIVRYDNRQDASRPMAYAPVIA